MNNFIRQKIAAIVLNRATNYFIVIFIFACAFFYVYFANRAVRVLTVLEKTRDEMQTLSIKVSEMESKRFLVDNTVNPSLAQHLGLIEVENPNFIIKSSKKTTLSLNTN